MRMTSTSLPMRPLKRFTMPLVFWRVGLGAAMPHFESAAGLLERVGGEAAADVGQHVSDGEGKE